MELEKLLLIDDVAALLRVTPRTIIRHRAGRISPLLADMPAPVNTRPLLWHPRDIAEWLEAKRTFKNNAESEPEQPRRPRGRPRLTAGGASGKGGAV